MKTTRQHPAWISAFPWVACALALVSTAQLPGAGEVIHNFAAPPGGANPFGGVIRDAAGNLYGTAVQGGTANAGVVFKIDPTGHQTVLYSFMGGADGLYPEASLIRDAAGNLYGTTNQGGSPASAGVVFKVDSAGHETVLYRFTGGADGGYPYSGVIRDSAGKLYGTTFGGGTANFGTVYKVDASGHETVLYSFTGGNDGAHPNAGVVRDTAGNLYGTTVNSGSGFAGVVYKVDPAGKQTVLHSFSGADGVEPYGGVVRDTAGSLYGTTFYGGNANQLRRCVQAGH